MGFDCGEIASMMVCWVRGLKEEGGERVYEPYQLSSKWPTVVIGSSIVSELCLENGGCLD